MLFSSYEFAPCGGARLDEAVLATDSGFEKIFRLPV
jgi:hypothetical protein